jgi:hypothetical protein
VFARSLTSGVVVAAFVALASSAGAVAASASPASVPGHSPVVPTSDHGRGAGVGFTEYSAVGTDTNGTVIGPSGNLYTLPAEAVGRTAVTLHGAGQYVEFTLARPANAVDLRYSIPDSADGTGLTAPLHVLVNGRPGADLSLTSKYTWFYGSYPFSNNPADLHGHHMYDDRRRGLPAGRPAGRAAPRLAVRAVLRRRPDRHNGLDRRDPERDQRRKPAAPRGLPAPRPVHGHRTPDGQRRDADRRR